MNKKILITIGIIVALILGAIVYIELPKEKKPVDIVKQRLEDVSIKLDDISSKASQLKNLAQKAEAKLKEGETDKVQACQEVIALLDEISGQSNNLSQRTKGAKGDIEAVEEANMPKEAAISLVSDLKQLRTDLINFGQGLNTSKQDILNYAEIIKDPTNIKEAIQVANGLKKFTKNIEEVEKEITQTSSGIDNYVSTLPPEVEKPTDLSQIKVAAEYYRLTDARVIGRSDEEAVRILKDMKVDIVRGWWGWKPIPESPEEKTDFFTPEEFQFAVETGYTYEDLQDITTLFKKENPDAIFMGSVGLQFLPHTRERDPITLEVIDKDRAWAMALDPKKWDIHISKEQLQCAWAKTTGRLEKKFDCSKFTKESVTIYFPDMTNKDWQNLFLDYIKKQINCGADAIWIDMYLKPVEVIIEAVCEDEGYKDLSECDLEKAAQHPAVKETADAAKELINEIHAYGLSKGKYIYVGGWGPRGEKAGALAGGGILELLPFLSSPDYDFVVTTPSSKEIYDKTPDKERWDAIIETQKEVFKDLPLFVWWDTGYKNSPTHIFSQKLNSTEQNEFLVMLDKYLSSKGLIFFYPVHGLLMGPWDESEEKILSFGKYPNYDALAPEFQTYETIKELALNKSTTTTTTTTTTSSSTTIPSICPVKGDKTLCDGKVDDFELLDYIDKWAQGLVGDFDLLEAIDNWASI